MNNAIRVFFGQYRYTTFGRSHCTALDNNPPELSLDIITVLHVALISSGTLIAIYVVLCS